MNSFEMIHPGSISYYVHEIHLFYLIVTHFKNSVSFEASLYALLMNLKLKMYCDFFIFIKTNDCAGVNGRKGKLFFQLFFRKTTEKKIFCVFLENGGIEKNSAFIGNRWKKNSVVFQKNSRIFSAVHTGTIVKTNCISWISLYVTKPPVIIFRDWLNFSRKTHKTARHDGGDDSATLRPLNSQHIWYNVFTDDFDLCTLSYPSTTKPILHASGP